MVATTGVSDDTGRRPRPEEEAQSRADSATRAVSQEHIGRLFRRVMQAFNDQFTARLRALGYDEVRPRHHAVFAHLDLEGTRATELAQRAGMTRQSMGELVAELVGFGYLEQLPDPTDRRSKVVVPTPRGRKHVGEARRIIREINEAWDARLGTQRMRQLRSALEEMASSLADGAVDGR